MVVKRLQKFESKKTGATVKVTQILRRNSVPSRDLILVKDVVGGKLVAGTSRSVYSDSLRRKYKLV